MKAKFPATFFLLSLSLLAFTPGALAKASGSKAPGWGYQGVEFSGSSQVSRLELERGLGLKQGASPEAADKAIERLKASLEQKHIKTSLDLAEEGNGYFIVVDVIDPTLVGVPSRHLKFPHHINLSSEKPFSVFAELLERRRQLSEQGRPVTEKYDNGLKYFSDEPCNQFAAQLHKQVPSMLFEFLSVIESDPDPRRRSQAIEVLNWVEEPVRICFTLIPAINDADEQVRASASRYIYPRISLLPENFPLSDLTEAFSNQMTRQTHQDRLLALRCLLELSRRHPQTIWSIKTFDEERLKQLKSTSVLSAIQEPATELIKLCQNPPPLKQKPKPISDEPNF